MTKIFDTIVIGADKEGVGVAKTLAKGGQSVLIISSYFNTITLKRLPEQLTAITGTVVLLGFRHGLFHVSADVLGAPLTFFGKHIIFATGMTAIPAPIKNHKSVYYDIKSLTGRYKKQVAVVYGDTPEAATYALALSKKFRYCYLCTSNFTINAPMEVVQQIESSKNIAHLPNSSIVGSEADSDGRLCALKLDTYAAVRADIFVFALGSQPNVPNFARQYIATDAHGFAEVTPTLASTLVPGVYAIGAICNRCGKDAIKQLSATILEK